MLCFAIVFACILDVQRLIKQISSQHKCFKKDALKDAWDKFDLFFSSLTVYEMHLILCIFFHAQTDDSVLFQGLTLTSTQTITLCICTSNFIDS